MVSWATMVTLRQAVLISAVSVGAVGLSKGFEPPGPQQRLEAIGPTTGLAAVLQRAFAADDTFPPMPTPGPNDWLAAHREPGKTIEEFQGSSPNRPNAQ